MKILTDKYLLKYIENIKNFNDNLELFKKNSYELDFDYLTDSSSVFSSNIEGNTLDLNSFLNSKITKNFTKDVKEINSLLEAYKFAQNNTLNQDNFLKTHAISSKTILIKSKRGIYRNEKVGVFGKNGLVYLAIESEFVADKMNDLFEDIETLFNKELTQEEIFYYSSLIHLIFVHIHPFSDGNGRQARLLEKWFLTSKIGHDFWKIKSEQFYKENREEYYKNINLGVNYYELNYNNSIDFLLMLPQCLTI